MLISNSICSSCMEGGSSFNSPAQSLNCCVKILSSHQSNLKTSLSMCHWHWTCTVTDCIKLEMNEHCQHIHIFSCNDWLYRDMHGLTSQGILYIYIYIYIYMTRKCSHNTYCITLVWHEECACFNMSRFEPSLNLLDYFLLETNIISSRN